MIMPYVKDNHPNFKTKNPIPLSIKKQDQSDRV